METTIRIFELIKSQTASLQKQLDEAKEEAKRLNGLVFTDLTGFLQKEINSDTFFGGLSHDGFHEGKVNMNRLQNSFQEYLSAKVVGSLSEKEAEIKELKDNINRYRAVISKAESSITEAKAERDEYKTAFLQEQAKVVELGEDMVNRETENYFSPPIQQTTNRETMTITDLPKEKEIRSKMTNGNIITALERFILNNQPRDEHEAERFRRQLLNVCEDYENRIIKIHASYLSPPPDSTTEAVEKEEEEIIREYMKIANIILKSYRNFNLFKQTKNKER